MVHRLVASTLVLMLAGCMTPGGATTMTKEKPAQALFVGDVTTAVVRYQVRDVDRAVAFYTGRLGFELTQRPAPILAIVSRGDLHLILSGPGSSGSRPMPDGAEQSPGGWNRLVLYVADLDATVADLRAAGSHFRNEIEVGPGGKQIQVDDPDGNPLELHEAPGE
jgi:catechol 2,3-dioxygenase-like lactoylglutathione lyase family enzyme